MPVKWQKSLVMFCNSVVICLNSWSLKFGEGHPTRAQVTNSLPYPYEIFFYQLKFVKINFHWHFKNTHNNEETITSVFMILFLHNWHIIMSGEIVYRSRQLCHRQFPGNGLLRDHREWLAIADRPQSPVLWEPSPNRLYDRCLPPLHPGQVSLSVLWPARNRGTGRIQSQRRLSRRGEAHIAAENLCSGLHLFLCWFIYQTTTGRDFDNWSM